MTEKTLSPKLLQFQKELQELCGRYLYVLTPQLTYGKGAITPIIAILDTPPLPSVTKIKKASKPVK